MAESGRSTALSWRKSTFSAEHECVEVAVNEKSIFIRDSKGGSVPLLEILADDWRIFLNGIKAG
jgi:hypothetical protein